MYNFQLQLANIFGKPSVTFSYDLHGYDPEIREGYDPIDDSGGGARSFTPTPPPTPGQKKRQNVSYHSVFELCLGIEEIAFQNRAP